MATDWNDYQEEAAALFRSMGLAAETNVTLHGVRASCKTPNRQVLRCAIGFDEAVF
jgi:hypothetical protein